MGVHRYTRATCRRRKAVISEVHDPIIVDGDKDLPVGGDEPEIPPIEGEAVLTPIEEPEEPEEEYTPATPPSEPEVVDAGFEVEDYTPTTPDYTPATPPPPPE